MRRNKRWGTSTTRSKPAQFERRRTLFACRLRTRYAISSTSQLAEVLWLTMAELRMLPRVGSSFGVFARDGPARSGGAVCAIRQAGIGTHRQTRKGSGGADDMVSAHSPSLERTRGWNKRVAEASRTFGGGRSTTSTRSARLILTVFPPPALVQSAPLPPKLGDSSTCAAGAPFDQPARGHAQARADCTRAG